MFLRRRLPAKRLTMATISAVILAAGDGTRMGGGTTKVLRRVSGRAILEHVIESCINNGVKDIVIVAGANYPHLKKFTDEKYGKLLKPRFVIQKKRLGTGHAVSMAMRAPLALKNSVLILNGDVPVSRWVIRGLTREFTKQRADGVLAVSEINDPAGYGRVIQDDHGGILRIVEEKDATRKEKSINLINGGIYLFKKELLQKYLKKIKLNRKKKEYYLTDLVEIAANNNKKIISRVINYKELTGVNNRLQLMEVAEIKNRQVIEKHSRRGVTIRDFNTIIIDEPVKIGSESVIRYHSVIKRNTRIGKKCLIGPGSVIDTSVIGDFCEVISSTIRNSRIGNHTNVGPYTNLRSHSVVGNNCRIGNFVEVKNCKIGDGTKVAHMTYLGDARVGKNTNIGANTVTCNYDGKKKHRTVIGNNVFIGSGVMLVAPVRIGNNAVIGAGSIITENVPANALAIARSRQIIKPNWVKKRR
jgi:bifunctional UDP-N-acetylglucosamine pyrophosphorylase / glucosamine-1-phosphate N-acetyltransferase